MLGASCESALVHKAVTIIILIILQRVAIDSKHVGGFHKAPSLGSVGYTLTPLALVTLRRLATKAFLRVIDGAAYGLEVRLLLGITIGTCVKHPHFHISQIQI